MKHLHNNLHVAGQLQEVDFRLLAEQGVKVIINNRPDDEEAGQLNHPQAKALAEELGMSYHYLPMANGQPLPADLVENFKHVLQNSEGPILAHCRSGMRSSFIWALGEVADGNITVDDAIAAAQGAGIPLQNAKSALESVAPES